MFQTTNQILFPLRISQDIRVLRYPRVSTMEHLPKGSGHNAPAQHPPAPHSAVVALKMFLGEKCCKKCYPTKGEFSRSHVMYADGKNSCCSLVFTIKRCCYCIVLSNTSMGVKIYNCPTAYLIKWRLHLLTDCCKAKKNPTSKKPKPYSARKGCGVL